jgi:hypothetical protein
MEEVLTEDKPDKIFKLVSHKKTLKVITPEDKLERLKRTCLNFLNKANGIIVEKPTTEEIKQKQLETKHKYLELHRTEYNAYMNNYMKEKYKNNDAHRLKEQERARLRWVKKREAKLLESSEIIINP